MEIDDYAIDMHTSAGRKMGKNKVDFIASGAVVVDEDKEYFEKSQERISKLQPLGF